MSHYDHPDCLALYRTVLERPHDDLPRLVLADWLDEHAGEIACGCDAGRVYESYGPDSRWVRCPTCNGTGLAPNGFAARAEFIRTQCELASSPAEVVAGNRCPVCDGPGVWRRGFGFDHQKRCGPCDEVWEPGQSLVTWKRSRLATREHVLFNKVRPQFGYDIKNVWMNDAEGAECFPLLIVRRGFVDEVRGPLAAFMEHAPRLAAEHPIARVVLTDREPYQNGYGHSLFLASWSRPSPDVLESAELGSALWHALPCLGTGKIIDGRYKSYPTRAAALQALSAACVAYCRHLASLPELPR